jgi:hypothetical protein
VQWTRQWDGRNDGLYDRAYAMALAPGRVYLTGESFSNRGWDYFDVPTLAYDDAGTLRWSSFFNSPDTGNDSEDVSDNILVDDAGRVIVIGSDWTKPGYDAIVRVFDPSGALLAERAVDTPGLEYNVHGERCAALVPGGLAFLAKSGGFGPLGPGTAVLGRLDLAFTPACPADVDGSGSAHLADIFAFLTAWFAGDPRADFDHARGVDILDIFAFVAAWFAGC